MFDKGLPISLFSYSSSFNLPFCLSFRSLLLLVGWWLGLLLLLLLQLPLFLLITRGTQLLLEGEERAHTYPKTATTTTTKLISASQHLHLIGAIQKYYSLQKLLQCFANDKMMIRLTDKVKVVVVDGALCRLATADCRLAD